MTTNTPTDPKTGATETATEPEAVVATGVSPYTYAVKPDYENNAETWWEAFFTAQANGTVPDEVRPLGELPAAEWLAVSKRALAWLRSLPGWNEPGAPLYARHPLIVRDARAATEEAK